MPYTLDCMLSKAGADGPAERRKSSAFGSGSADIIPQDNLYFYVTIDRIDGNGDEGRSLFDVFTSIP